MGFPRWRVDTFNTCGCRNAWCSLNPNDSLKAFDVSVLFSFEVSRLLCSTFVEVEPLLLLLFPNASANDLYDFPVEFGMYNF